MTTDLRILDEAEEELIDAEDWYEAQRKGLGLEFRLAIYEAMARRLQLPNLSTSVLNVPEWVGARQVFVKRFPYRIVFIEEAGCR